VIILQQYNNSRQEFEMGFIFWLRRKRRRRLVGIPLSYHTSSDRLGRKKEARFWPPKASIFSRMLIKYLTIKDKIKNYIWGLHI